MDTNKRAAVHGATSPKAGVPDEQKITRLRRLSLRTLIALLPVLMVSAASGQAARTSAHENAATVIVRQSIAAMGGEAWAGAGAATARLSVTRPWGKTPTVSQRSDDWSAGKARLRTEEASTAKTKGRANATLNTDQARIVKDGTGKAVAMPPLLSDLVELARIYPAAALRLALQREECSFKLLSKPDYHPSMVLQSCLARRSGMVNFIWWFDASSLPVKVDLPVSGVNARLEVTETAIFHDFQQVHGLSIPQSVELESHGMPHGSIAISNVSFQASLPDASFSTQSIQ